MDFSGVRFKEMITLNLTLKLSIQLIFFLFIIPYYTHLEIVGKVVLVSDQVAVETVDECRVSLRRLEVPRADRVLLQVPHVVLMAVESALGEEDRS